MIKIIRATKADDFSDAYKLIKELAIFENEPDAVTNPLDTFVAQGQGNQALYKLWLAKESNKTVGMALCYTAFSTWKGKMLYLDDLVVTESYRRQGIGQLLLDTVLKHAQKEAYQLVKWQVLDWNNPAIELYKKYGATIDKTWWDCKVYKNQYNKLLED